MMNNYTSVQLLITLTTNPLGSLRWANKGRKAAPNFTIIVQKWGVYIHKVSSPEEYLLTTNHTLAPETEPLNYLWEGYRYVIN